MKENYTIPTIQITAQKDKNKFILNTIIPNNGITIIMKFVCDKDAIEFSAIVPIRYEFNGMEHDIDNVVFSHFHKLEYKEDEKSGDKLLDFSKFHSKVIKAFDYFATHNYPIGVMVNIIMDRIIEIYKVII